MNVATLIEKLQSLPPETMVVKFHETEGYDDVWFVEGTHNNHQDGDQYVLRVNPAKFVKGVGKADYIFREKPSKSRKVPFVVLY